MDSQAAIDARTPVTGIPGVGERTAARLAHLGIRSAGDLVRHLPMRHERRLAERSIAETASQVTDESANVRLQ
ncbi:MAG: hypothetical protein ACKPEA_02685, partial [Planctomycetota bacterium]